MDASLYRAGLTGATHDTSTKTERAVKTTATSGGWW
ncbi:hypothetical protein FB470_005204 [Amycolatopsis thermophila]|uniref:Uncharacterized protein n=1 Tax=Amycolatopsis thermophila TaxID=206084 RepID=A0ABU0F0X0_9PSEU|nr:hypothetical protein [Amycolatopsis thermophila]